MKIILAAAAVLFLSLNASASAARKPCTPKDFQKIQMALDTQEVRVGKDLVEELNGVLIQEMGPTCDVLIGLAPGIGIPGERRLNYEITSATASYSVSLVSSLEENTVYVVITKTDTASSLKRACDFQDWQKIESALATQEVRVGKEFVAELQSVMAQEFAPTCEVVIDTTIRMGIPGEKRVTFELGTAGTVYEVTLVSSLEENTHYVVIEKQ